MSKLSAGIVGVGSLAALSCSDLGSNDFSIGGNGSGGGPSLPTILNSQIGAGGGGGVGVPIAFAGFTPTVGDTLAVVLVANYSVGFEPVITSLTDNLGNHFTEAGAFYQTQSSTAFAGNDIATHLFYLAGCAAGLTGLILTATGAGPAFEFMIFDLSPCAFVSATSAVGSGAVASIPGSSQTHPGNTFYLDILYLDQPVNVAGISVTPASWNPSPMVAGIQSDAYQANLTSTGLQQATFAVPAATFPPFSWIVAGAMFA